jgi:hypothetical protein
MSYHAKMMNLAHTEATCTLSYGMGHRDARHAAAEIANEADNEIADLRLALREMLQVQDGVPMMGTEATRRAERARALLDKSE